MATLAGFLFLVSCATVQPIAGDRLAGLDAFWAEVSRSVEEGDFKGYRATCHPEGVLVTGVKKDAYPLAAALARWKQEFDDTKSGKIQAGVSFRFSERLGNETTAHETGMFRYYQIKPDGEKVTEYIHFEALLIQKAGGWKVLMEYQKSKGSKAEWDALPEG